MHHRSDELLAESSNSPLLKSDVVRSHLRPSTKHLKEDDPRIVCEYSSPKISRILSTISFCISKLVRNFGRNSTKRDEFSEPLFPVVDTMDCDKISLARSKAVKTSHARNKGTYRYM